ncbi:bestrophin-like domain [Bordetella genomosp. 9]|nr:hypothetical protein [Bordetella genomosp. 9]
MHIALVVFLLVTGSALLGLRLRRLLPPHHVQSESLDAIKLTTGLIATLAALVLGLLVSSSKSAMDAVNAELTRNAARILQLDAVLRDYGPAAAELRRDMLRDYAATVALLSEETPLMVDRATVPWRLHRLQDYQDRMIALPADDDVHRQLRTQAVQLQAQISATRWLLVLQRDGSVSVPLLFVLVVWLMIIFLAFGVLSPRNGAVVVALLLCAVSASGAIFLILEMDRPLDGMIHISTTPLRDALLRLQQ